MQNKNLFKTIVKISLISLVFAMSMFQFSLPPAKAAALTLVSDTLSRLKANTPSNHDVRFKTPTGVDSNFDNITITFGNDFNMGSVSYADMDLEVDAACDGNYETEKILALNADLGIWGVKVSGQAVTLSAPTDAGPGEIAANSCVRVEIGTNAGGSNQITNGAADDDDTVIIEGAFGDTGSLIVDIIDDDQVVITATVDPTFTFTISSNTCNLGTLTTTSVATCSYTLAVGTNADNGAQITIQAISDGTNPYLNRDGAPTTYIDNITEGNLVTPGIEGYGIAVTGGAGWTVEGDFATDDTPIPDLITNILSTSGPISSSDFSTITHKAAISSTTEAGTYSQTVQYIATGTF